MEMLVSALTCRPDCCTEFTVHVPASAGRVQHRVGLLDTRGNIGHRLENVKDMYKQPGSTP